MYKNLDFYVHQERPRLLASFFGLDLVAINIKYLFDFLVGSSKGKANIHDKTLKVPNPSSTNNKIVRLESVAINMKYLMKIFFSEM